MIRALAREVDRDPLDVVGVHLVGGIIGTLGVGFFDTATGISDNVVAWLSAQRRETARGKP